MEVSGKRLRSGQSELRGLIARLADSTRPDPELSGIHLRLAHRITLIAPMIEGLWISRCPIFDGSAQHLLWSRYRRRLNDRLTEIGAGLLNKRIKRSDIGYPACRNDAMINQNGLT